MNPLITGVEPKSPAAKARIKPGEKLKKINGQVIYDVLDYKYFEADCELELLLENRRGKERVVYIEKEEDEDLGLSFESYLMDKERGCANKCLFCFVDQLPKNMRAPLYFKDDDVRLSFLTGNYVTLTNLSEREITRICQQRISPLNISVHATSPELRAKLLGNRRGAEGFEIIKKFANSGVTMNCQIVCCPGLNDGKELEKSMYDLAELYPQVSSVSIVPVGLTKHREGLAQLKVVDKVVAESIIDTVENFADKCVFEKGSRIFFCADELYIRAKRELPEEEYYEGYPQLENGVGMVRLLCSEFVEELGQIDYTGSEPFSIATGMAVAPQIEKLLSLAKEKCPNLRGTVYSIENDFFGHTVDVAGLITGRDLIAQLSGKQLGKRLLISATMLRHGGDVFLDDITPQQVEQALGVELICVPQDGAALVRAMFGE